MGKLSPPQIVVGSFLVVILIGTLFLTLPLATVNGRGLSLVDALFTATSATCVTGLIVVDTGRTFTLAGQLAILLLIQIGGLGVMTFSTFFLSLVGRRISLKGKILVQDALNYYEMGSLIELIRHILAFTFILEFFGALLLFSPLSERLGVARGLYCAIFHSISAFCNAGFSLFSNSLVSFQGSLLVNLTMIALIILGGLGFPVLHNLYRLTLRREKEAATPGLKFQTQLVFAASIILITLGTSLFLLFEWHYSLNGLPLKNKLLISLFQSVTPRTAGFNTVDISILRDVTLLSFLILMFIGASPGGTGGGIKTTTMAIVLFTIKSIIRRDPEVSILKRSIPWSVVSKAFAIFFLSLTLVIITTLMVLEIEGFPLRRVAFEVVSAFGTVGLSTGITSQLSSGSKALLSVVMLTGRVGPLTLVLAMAGRERPPEIRYPEAQVMVG